ncbi:MAG: polyphosphate kinase 1 [Phycisphaerae bacterium]|nr:polyphosphate kinase 1 [Phycisphaerae bacterium]
MSAAAFDGEMCLVNRDLSWLEFNRRVLEQARDDRTPLLTRVRFLSIFASNLDEFFMKRVGYIKRQAESRLAASTPDGMTPRNLLFAIRSMVAELTELQSRCYLDDVAPALARHGIHILSYGELTPAERATVDRWFIESVFPVLTPLAVDPGHRFPFISNLSENIGVMVSAPEDGAERGFARIKIPDVLPRLVPLPRREGDRARYTTLHDVVRHNLDDLFPGMRIHDTILFRLTRNAAIEIEDEQPEDLLVSVENELKLRRFAKAVRLEVSPNPPRGVVDFLTRELRLEPEDVYERAGPIEYADLLPIADMDVPELREPRWTPVHHPRLRPEAMESDAAVFAAIRERDILLHHPYESFNSSVERFIAAAARDPDVLAIKQTIYRTSRDSPFVASLIRAAEEGKQVACLVELRARFDESKNVRFARLLEKAGVHVAYGVVGFKTHCKTSLVVRREHDPEGRPILRSYAHLGTGNYNPSTAQLYTDLGLLTCDPAITADVVNLFNFLTGRSAKRDYTDLLVAPAGMRQAFMDLIDREIAHARAAAADPSLPGGRIVAKMNSLEDLKITRKLYEASAAGVRITLIVRGFCCLRPGVPGLSENIRVISVVGRFLEHSRLFHFGAGHRDPVDGLWYISSADWMYRNLSARVEAACPIKDRHARARIAAIIEIMLADHRCAWDIGPDGRSTQRRPPPDAAPDSPAARGTFETLMDLARREDA